MALTTGAGEISACLEITIGYGNVHRFDSGRFGVNFDFTGNSSEKVWAKDPTAVSGNQALYLEYLALGCSSGSINIYEASNGVLLFGVMAPVEASAGPFAIAYDFRDDPLVCMTADNTLSLCVSAPNAYAHGFFKGYWGPIT